MRTACLALLLPALLCVAPAASTAEEQASSLPAAINAAWVEEALEAAGENAAELRKAIGHFPNDPQKRHAARFLVAHMPGKGYIRTELQDGAGKRIEFDPLAYATFKETVAAFEALEAKHGEIEFKRDQKIEDVKTITGDFLIKHINLSFKVWRGAYESHRVSFEAFLEYVLPYRGSQEPVDEWLEPLMKRYAAKAAADGGATTPEELYMWVTKDVAKRVRFNERYYLHPTDQSFTEMGRTGQGRCEDITNMQTFAARSLALATAADYTPYWAHRDNNHAWNVLLDKDGLGFSRGNAHAAKIYRKTYAIQRDSLPFRLPKGRVPPNRFMASTVARDVTTQYAKTTDVVVKVDTDEKHAYLCVFNAGAWRAIHWGAVKDGTVLFTAMGRNIAYLPCIHDGKGLKAVHPPLLVHKDGTTQVLAGEAAGTSVTAIAVHPKKVSPDTFKVTPVSHLKEGTTYVLKRWNTATGTWADVREFKATAVAPSFRDLPGDGLYWLVAGKSQRKERIWTIGPKGFQRWW